MAKIAGKKAYLNLDVKFLCGDKVYSGVASNLTPHNMILHAKLKFPLECKEAFEVLMIFNKKRVIVPVKIIQFVKTDCFYDAIEVEIMTPPQEYLLFIGQGTYQRVHFLNELKGKKKDIVPPEPPPKGR